MSAGKPIDLINLSINFSLNGSQIGRFFFIGFGISWIPDNSREANLSILFIFIINWSMFVYSRFSHKHTCRYIVIYYVLIPLFYTNIFKTCLMLHVVWCVFYNNLVCPSSFQAFYDKFENLDTVTHEHTWVLGPRDIGLTWSDRQKNTESWELFSVPKTNSRIFGPN